MTRRLNVALIGRTSMLLSAGKAISADGHRIGLVATCKHSGHEGVTEKDFEAFARALDAPFLMHPELTSPKGLATIASSQCDIAISMNWLNLIPSTVRDLFPLGIFNAHPGDLPRFKGNACPNWAILMGEPKIGLTIHAMVDELDAGPIADKSFFEVGEETDISDVYAWLAVGVPEAFRRIIRAASSGYLSFEAQPTDPALGLRCYPRRPEDGRIDWTDSVDDVLRLIRASARPFDGAYSILNAGRRLTIWKACREPAYEPFAAVPGQIAYSVTGDPVIAGVDGYIRLVDITLENSSSQQESKAAVLSSLRNRLT